MPRWKVIERMFRGWTPHYADSIEWWELWKGSNFLAYPFPGTRLEQPTGVLEDFRAYDWLSEMYELKKKAPDATNLKPFFGAKRETS